MVRQWDGWAVKQDGLPHPRNGKVNNPRPLRGKGRRLLGGVGVSSDGGERARKREGEREVSEKRKGAITRTRGSSWAAVVKERWEVIRVNYSRSITRAIKVRAKRLLITKEANLSVSLAQPLRQPLQQRRPPCALDLPANLPARLLACYSPSSLIPFASGRPFLFRTHLVSLSLLDRRRLGTVVYSTSLEIPLRILLLERVCVTVISVATLSRLSGAFPPPNSRPSRWSPEGGTELWGRGLDISGVLSVISVVLLLPPNSPPSLPPSFPPATPRSPIYSLRASPRSPPEARELGGLPGALLPPPRPPLPLVSFSPLGRHTKCGRLGADGLRGW